MNQFYMGIGTWCYEAQCTTKPLLGVPVHTMSVLYFSRESNQMSIQRIEQTQCDQY